jgi:4-amino-4-deoxy-L-arabinose transferase-like glycosyltransferase
MLKKSWNKELLLLLVILAVGLGLRVWGLNQGLPSSYYPDERHFINRAMSFGTWDFNPHWFHKPALYMYILFLEYGLYFMIGKAVGLFASLQDFARLYINDLSSFLIIGRLTTVLLGTATIWLVYKLGRRMYGRQTALSAAVLLTFTFAHVKSSQWVKADVPMAFFAFVSFYFIYRILEAGRYRHYVLAGLFHGSGSSMATSYRPFCFCCWVFSSVRPIIFSIPIGSNPIWPFGSTGEPGAWWVGQRRRSFR